MPERSEVNPLSREVASHLQMVAKRGSIVMTDPRHGAVHGTSLETIRAMFKSGTIVGYSFKKPLNDIRFGDLSVYPTRSIEGAISHLTDPSIHRQMIEDPEESIEYANGYARSIAQRHALLTTLGIPLTDQTAMRYADDLRFSHDFDEEMFAQARAYFRRRRFSGADIDAALQTALLRRGFLLGLSPDIASTAGVILHNGDSDASDIRVSTNGQGLPYRLISGIQPLGKIEEAELRRLALNG